MVTLTDIEDTAHQVYNAHSTNTGWPDCYNISQAIKDALIRDHEINMEHITILECFPQPGYGHYVVEVNSIVTGESILIDASFEQFDDKTDTPISVGTDVDPVIVLTPAPSYIFYPQ